jgi:hypothetical protein
MHVTHIGLLEYFIDLVGVNMLLCIMSILCCFACIYIDNDIICFMIQDIVC